jgi:methionyl-tRNA formyltransferase
LRITVTDRSSFRPTVLAVGYKGGLFVSGLLAAGVQPARIVTYRQDGDRSDAFDMMLAMARSGGITIEENHHPQLDRDPLIFVVGWQFLLHDGLDRTVVFHDSLLPKSRGFSPTVTAMLKSAEFVGVSAIRPAKGRDDGPILGSRTVSVPAASNLKSVLELQSRAMVDLAKEIIERTSHGNLVGTLQDEAQATYSLWRDAFDYFIDWRRSSEEILRHIQAHGYPYEGARGVLNDQLIMIQGARLGPDVAFAIRDPGKLWEIDGPRALVTCGTGTLWIEDARDVDGQPFQFRRLRSRFLTADTAWMRPFLRS